MANCASALRCPLHLRRGSSALPRVACLRPRRTVLRPLRRFGSPLRSPCPPDCPLTTLPALFSLLSSLLSSVFLLPFGFLFFVLPSLSLPYAFSHSLSVRFSRSCFTTPRPAPAYRVLLPLSRPAPSSHSFSCSLLPPWPPAYFTGSLVWLFVIAQGPFFPSSSCFLLWLASLVPFSCFFLLSLAHVSCSAWCVSRIRLLRSLFSCSCFTFLCRALLLDHPDPPVRGSYLPRPSSTCL